MFSSHLGLRFQLRTGEPGFAGRTDGRVRDQLGPPFTRHNQSPPDEPPVMVPPVRYIAAGAGLSATGRAGRGT
jgi:hypothetical protein